MGRTPPLPIIKAATRLSRALHRIADAPQPPPLAMFNLMNSSVISSVLIALCELGVGDALADGPLPADRLAADIGADADSLHRLLRVAESFGVVRRTRTGYALTRIGQGLRSDAPLSMVPWAKYVAHPTLQAAWNALAEGVRTGRPAFQIAHGRSTWDWFAAEPEVGAGFDAVMRAVCDFNGADLAALGDWPSGGTVCDVAGGIGTLLSHILATDPTMRGVLSDQPQVIDQAPAFLAERGIADRVRTIGGDMFEPLTIEADVFVLKDVPHDWADAQCVTILQRVAGTMRAGDRLVLVEILQDPVKPHPMVPVTDLLMMSQTDGGRQRSVAELEALLERAGLRRTAVREGPVHSLVEAVLSPGGSA